MSEVIREEKTMDMKKSVSNEELLDITKKAFDNDEVAEFLCGENGYAIHGNRDIPTDIPTNFGRIVEVCGLNRGAETPGNLERCSGQPKAPQTRIA